MAKPRKGKLTKENFGYSMPMDAPLYNKPPIYYKNVEVILIPFETDEAAAVAMLPEGLELTSPATAAVMFIQYHFSSFGAYDEAILGINCLWKGAPKIYFPHIVVNNNEIPLAGGREIWGYSKKFAHIQITQEGDLFMCTMERPKGNRIVTGIFKPSLRIPDAEIPFEPLSLRVIPGSEEGAAGVAELVEADVEMIDPDLWMGTGSLQFHSTSVFDPWHKLEIKKVLDAMYINYDGVLGLPKVLKRY
jgi:acetoacetate decarboxylase